MYVPTQVCNTTVLIQVTAEYLIIITGRELRGRLMGQNVYRATDYDILPLNPDVIVSSPPNLAEAHLLHLVRSHLAGGNFLFSYAWDLTRRLQAQWQSLQEDAGKALWEVVRPSPPHIRTEVQTVVPGG